MISIVSSNLSTNNFQNKNSGYLQSELFVFDSQLSVINDDIVRLQAELTEKTKLKKTISKTRNLIDKKIATIDSAIHSLVDAFKGFGGATIDCKTLILTAVENMLSDVIDSTEITPLAQPSIVEAPTKEKEKEEITIPATSPLTMKKASDEDLSSTPNDNLKEGTAACPSPLLEERDEVNTLLHVSVTEEVIKEEESNEILAEFPKPSDNKSTDVFSWILTENETVGYYKNKGTATVHTVYLGSNNKAHLKNTLTQLVKLFEGLSGEIRLAQRLQTKYELKLWGITEEAEVNWLAGFDYKSDLATQIVRHLTPQGEPLKGTEPLLISIQNRYHNCVCTFLGSENGEQVYALIEGGIAFPIKLDEWYAMVYKAKVDEQIYLVQHYTDEKIYEEPASLVMSWAKQDGYVGMDITEAVDYLNDLGKILVQEKPEKTEIEPTKPEWEQITATLKYNEKEGLAQFIVPNKDIASLWVDKLAKEAKIDVKVGANAAGEVCVRGFISKERAVDIDWQYSFTEVVPSWAIPLMAKQLQENTLTFTFITNFTDAILHRLGWDADQSNNYLLKKFRKESRSRLSDEELFVYAEDLWSLFETIGEVR
jgi:hypothetical protein